MNAFDALLDMRRVMGLRKWLENVCDRRREAAVADIDYDLACLWRDELRDWLGAMAKE